MQAQKAHAPSRSYKRHFVSRTKRVGGDDGVAQLRHRSIFFLANSLATKERKNLAGTLERIARVHGGKIVNDDDVTSLPSIRHKKSRPKSERPRYESG